MRDTLPAGLRLMEQPEGLTLSDGSMELRADFSRMLPRLQPHRLSRELLVRAARVRGGMSTPRAVDATAGLGEDALLLAAAGFEVTLFEYDAVIASLLADGLERARRQPELVEAVGRMRLVVGDSIGGLHAMAADASPDVVFLDPMFPARRKGAATKKKLQMLRLLEPPVVDEGALLDAALAAHPRKVVIKRPLKGPALAGRSPSYSLSGKVVRYDCIVLPW